jgi:hypothetical protein
MAMSAPRLPVQIQKVVCVGRILAMQDESHGGESKESQTPCQSRHFERENGQTSVLKDMVFCLGEEARRKSWPLVFNRRLFMDTLSWE